MYQDHINETNLLVRIFNTKESLYYAWIMIVASAMDEFIFMNSLPHRIKNYNKNEIDNMNDNECHNNKNQWMINSHDMSEGMGL